MPAAARRLRTLEQELDALGDDAMLLSELDGYLTGILVCPELIEPSEWLPAVWGETGDGDGAVFATSAVFESKEHLDDVVAAIMAHYNAIARILHERPEKYAPVFEIDGRNGDVLWAIWMEGFERAFALRPEAWSPLCLDEESQESDVTEEIASMNLMAAFMAIALGCEADLDLTPEQVEMMTDEAPAVIPGVITTLNAWRRSQRPDPGLTGGSTPKTGRNAPCPCGSGKKYKKCCGLN